MNDLLHRSASKDTIFLRMAGYLRLLNNVVETRFADGDSALTIGGLFNEPDAVHRAGREELGRLDILGGEIIQPLVHALNELRPSPAVLIPCGTLALVPLHTIAHDNGGRCLIDDVGRLVRPVRPGAAPRERAALAGSGRPVLAGVGNPLLHSQPLWFANARAGRDLRAWRRTGAVG